MMKALLSSVAAVGFAAAVLSSAPASAADPVLIPIFPTFSSVDETIGLGNFFSETWSATAAGTAIVTDWAVPGDNFDVFKNSVFVGATNVPDCTKDGPGGCTVGGPVYAADGEAGWDSSIFAHLTVPVAKGDLITIKAISIPTGFADSTVAVSEAPELSTWAMLIIGFAGLGLAGYRGSRRSVALAG